MPRIRKVEISNFRGIRELTWCPANGINCLIGPGDSGKSSILDAIDYCLGARRSIQFTDADFHRLDVETPIRIAVTLGELDDVLKSLETYGQYLRGFHAETGDVSDEPEQTAETALTVKLTVASDLEPTWALLSERAEAQGLGRNLSWKDRVRLAPTRIGVAADYHLGWRRGSVLNRVSEERADAAAALARAARDARAAFGDEAQSQLGNALAIVATTAKELGIPIGNDIKAMLDAHSVSFSGGAISLHDETGVPLRNLGSGSTRLLIAGLQRKAAKQSTIVLVDELESGLEPHRIIRFVDSLGAKELKPPLQVFMTTHSPIALRELAGSQLFVTRPMIDAHEVMIVGTDDDVQGTIRSFPDAFLASSVIICEGGTEVGLIRGLDQCRTANGQVSIIALGTALADSGGGDADRALRRAAAFRSLGYRAAVVRDDDKKPSADAERAFVANGGMVVAWRDGRTLEDELFLSLSDVSVCKLLDRAAELHGEKLIDEHVKSASQNARDLRAIRAEAVTTGISLESRQFLGKAAKSKRAGWFKTVTCMEEVARDIVGPDLANADAGFRTLIDQLFSWTTNARE